jgi:hypothetical protein
MTIIDQTQAPTPYAVGGALEILTAALKHDPEYAWVWHCNIAQANMTAGHLKWKESNEAACRTMDQLFGVDTSQKFKELLKLRTPGTTNV